MQASSKLPGRADRRRRRWLVAASTPLLVLVIVLLAACAAAGPTTGPGGGAGSSAGGGQAGGGGTGSGTGGGQAGGGDALVAAAASIQDKCSVVPMDLIEKVVGGKADLTRTVEGYCTAAARPGGGPAAVLVDLEACKPDNLCLIDTDPPAGSRSVPDLGAGAWLENMGDNDIAELKVVLGKDPAGLLWVEITGNDHNNDVKTHEDDAIAIARAVLAALK